MSTFLFTGCSKVPAPLTHTTRCDSDIYAMRSAQCLEKTELLKRLEPYPVIFVGDHHTSEESHRFVVELIEGLDELGYRIHLGNEWFSSEDNGLLAEYAEGLIDDGNFTQKIEWKKKAGYKFELYQPLYHALQENGGVMYGINMSKALQKKISDHNITAMSDTEQSFLADLDLNVSAHQQMLSPFFSHCHGSKKGESDDECKHRMNRVQVAWDTMMAQESAKLANAHLSSSRDKLVIFVGSMHLAYNLGVNMRFGRYSNQPYITVIPSVKSDQGIEHALADYLFLYTPKPESSQAE